MGVLYTILQWVCLWSLVLQVQLVLNDFKQCLRELIRHVRLSSMKHQAEEKKEFIFEDPEKPNKRVSKRANKRANKKRNVEILEDREKNDFMLQHQNLKETFEDLENDRTKGQHGMTNKEIFEDLKDDLECGPFFRRKKYETLQIHDLRPLGVGAEAEVFKATGTEQSGKTSMLAVKVYSGFSLEDLRTQWPPRLLKVAFQHVIQHKVDNPNYYLCLPLEATVLEDDRFAFIFPRYGGDLRKLIDMEKNKPPFSPSYTFSILHKIAKGMEMLQYMGFSHKDLKAKNILCSLGEFEHGNNSCISSLHIGDFESSAHTIGTSVWRAPEVLHRLKNRKHIGRLSRASNWRRARKILSVVLLFPLSSRRNSAREAADVYSYAMTCYEVLTGHNPACPEGELCEDCEQCRSPALREQAVRAFDAMCPGIGELVSGCWHDDPLHRPSFKTIVSILETIRLGHLEKKKKHCGGHAKGLSLRVDFANEAEIKNEQKANTPKEKRGVTALPSPRRIKVQKVQKERNIRREKSRNRRRSEKTSVHSFNFRALCQSRSLDEEKLPSTEKKMSSTCCKSPCAESKY